MAHGKQTFQYGGHQVTLETGRIARQASGSALVTVDDTMVLGTVVGGGLRDGVNFMPLTVNYQEKYYAAGRIPGSFFRREGRPTEKETLTSRLIDRPLRPLFPKQFRNEVHVICTVLSASPDIDPDIPAMLSASAAMALSGIPFAGPLAAARVGYTSADGYLLNPGYAALEDSTLDMIVAGTKDALLMVESEANEMPEDLMLGAVLFAHQEMQVAIDSIQALAAQAAKPAWNWKPAPVDEALQQSCRSQHGEAVAEAFQIAEKAQRSQQLAELSARAVQGFVADGVSEAAANDAMRALQRHVVREQVLNGKPRIDGRDNQSVRPIETEVGLLPRAHGSALFTRGETQAIGAVTLGSMRSAQVVDALAGESKDVFMLHYNFPPYSVGEAGRMMPPNRREIGHGRLARRAINAALPDYETFPYTVRVVSEITESNGSSSMATVCASSMALMDAGVPMKAPVAGIAMGLVKEGERYAVLTDILGDEDHLGDMDFKVAGTAQGINALQMDIKTDGITEAIMEVALKQAHAARLHILAEMQKTLGAPREQVSAHAPRIETLRIDVDKIRDIIGKGGVTIRAICEESGADINIEDDGVVQIYATSAESLELASSRIRAITEDPEIGTIYDGKVVKIMDFGAFVNFLPGRDGLVHISQIAPRRIDKVTDVLSESQEVRVKVLDIDERGRVRLSIKAVEETENA